MSETTASTTAPPVLTAARAAVMILTAAHSGDVPIPDHVHLVTLDETETLLSVFVSSFEDLAAWSTWLEEPIKVSDGATDSGRLHCSVDGLMFDHRVRAICMHAPVGDELVNL